VAGARETAGLLLADLDALLTRYADALEAHEIPRPYRPREDPELGNHR
jgi:hypothetical protein